MILKDILTHWDITNERIEQIYKTTWVIGDRYILKVNKNLGWLQSNIKVIRILSKYNIPVSRIIKTVDGLDYASDGNSYYLLSEKIRGEHIKDIFCYDYIERSYEIGKIISKLHIAFKVCEKEINCYDNNFYNEMTGWVIETYRSKMITYVPEEIIMGCINELENTYFKLERQLIHRDIHLGNMLFDNNTLTGYIDFDLCQINARIFDICYMALSFLVGNVRDDDKTKKWIEILHQLIIGYNSLTPLTYIEKSTIWVMMIAIEILFVAYFTNLNDMENLNGALEMLTWIWNNKNQINSVIINVTN